MMSHQIDFYYFEKHANEDVIYVYYIEDKENPLCEIIDKESRNDFNKFKMACEKFR